MKVVKRDGRKVSFDKEKIRDAIIAAFIDVDGEITSEAKRKATVIANNIENIGKTEKKSMTVEHIQDLVEEGLMNSNRKDVAKSFIIYRNDRNRQRDMKSAFFQKVGEKVTASNVQNQNANVDEHSFGGRMGEANSELMRKYAIDNLLSPMARKNHEENMIYEHDLDHYPVGDHNCLSMPLDKLLANGFNTRQTDVRPANSVNTAFQLVAVLFQLQSLQQFGGVSSTHLDWTMIPYVKKSLRKHYIFAWLKDKPDFLDLNLINMYFDYYDENIDSDLNIRVTRNKLDDWIDSYKNNFYEETGLKDEDFYFDSKKLDKKYYQIALLETICEVQQAVEGLYHNLNTLQSRSGNQLPFTSINYGTCILPEGRLITKAILDGSLKGVGKLRKTSIFPCGIFQYMKGVNNAPGTTNYDLYKLALKSTAKRLYPNYANVDWSGNAGYDINDPKTYFSTMGCRTANGWDANGFGQLKDGRGNICPVTIILPTLAMMSKEATNNEEERINYFFDLLDTKIAEARDMLIERYQYMCSQSPDSAKFMYENGTMEGYVPEEGIRSALKHGTLVIGQLGLAECLQLLINCDQTEERGMELAKRIEQLFKDRCAEFKSVLREDEDGYQYYLNFGVYYTPAENLCYKAMKKFQEKYGVIPNVSDKEFFTNSMHVPVWKHMNPFEKIDIESQLTGYSNAGCITYVELESSAFNNIEALEAIVNYAMDKDVPYFAINIPNDTCMECGWIDDMNENCPMCGSDNIRRLRRVTGYLTGDYKTAFNLGKQQEVEMRYKHGKELDDSRWNRQYSFGKDLTKS